jgi:hypothetical protein
VLLERLLREPTHLGKVVVTAQRNRLSVSVRSTGTKHPAAAKKRVKMRPVQRYS